MEGKVWLFQDNIDTDLIYPAQFMNTAEPEVMATHCMGGLAPDFYKSIAAGDIFVGGSNFGCGSSREHAPIAIRAAGVSCVIARSFARIFYRNAINTGLPILECPELVDDVSEGDVLSVDLNTGVIENKTTGHSFQTIPFPAFIQEIIKNGGLISYISEGRG